MIKNANITGIQVIPMRRGCMSSGYVSVEVIELVSKSSYWV